MIKSKLIDILETFSEDEFRDFGKFINSPYFNTNKKLVSAYEFIKKFYNNFSDPDFSKEGLYNELFPGSKYRDLEIRKLLSGLTKLAGEFLGQKIYDEEIFEKNIHIAGALITKNLISPAEKIIEKLESDHTGGKINGQHHFYDLMKIQIKKKSIELKKESFQTDDLTEEKINSYLLNYFVSFSTKIIQNIRAKQYYNLISDEHELTKFFTLIDIDKFIDWLQNSQTEYSETLIMNLCIIKCVNGLYDETAYKKFRELLLKNHSKYAHFELNNLFTCLQGIQIKRFRENAPGALPEIFRLNNLILDHDAYAFYPGGNMPYSTFVTMVTIGISCNKYDWVKDFIDKYTPLLQEKHRQSLYNYAMAELAYAAGQAGSSLKFTSKIEYEGFFMKHEVNILKLKIFYDENDYISMQYQLDTYKKLVEGNKYVGKLQYEIYSGFLKNYSELLKIKENKDKTAAGFLLNKIKNSKHLIAKQWLELKASELV